MKLRKIAMLVLGACITVTGCKSTHQPSFVALSDVKQCTQFKTPRIVYSLEKLDFQADLVANETVWKEGIPIFREIYSNPEDQPVYIWISNGENNLTVLTRIDEHVHHVFLQDKTFNLSKISRANFKLDQISVTNDSEDGENSVDLIPFSSNSNWMKFSISPHGKMEVQWIAHAAVSDHRCPLWSRRTIQLNDQNPDVIVDVTEQNIVGASLSGTINRGVRASFADTVGALKSRSMVSTREELNFNAGDVTSQPSDQPLGCDGLIQLMP